MNTLLAEAMRQLNLKSGEMQRIDVKGQRLEIRVLPIEDDSSFAGAPMLDLRLEVPSSPNARTVTVSRGRLMLPPPLQIDESDLAPE